MIIEFPEFRSRARLFVPAGLVVDTAGLGTLPWEATFEIVREGALPEAAPEGALCTFIDFLFYDGSPSCREWMERLLQGNVLHPLAFLLHPSAQCMAACAAWELPRFACDLADVASWRGLPHALFLNLEGLFHSDYGELRSVFPRRSGYVRLVELAVDSTRWLTGALAARLEPDEGSHYGGALVITQAPTLEGACSASEMLEKLFDEASWPLWQIAVDTGRKSLGLTMLLAYRDGVMPDQPEVQGMDVSGIRLGTLPLFSRSSRAELVT
jgi:hypothetical protein